MTSLLDTLKMNSNFDRHMVGFDSLFDNLTNLSNAHRDERYPPYNILKIGDNNYTIELAVAGFSKDDISISRNQDKLIIKSDSENDDDELDKIANNYIYRGLAKRAFTRTFTLAENVFVTDAKMVDGLLIISLEHKVPKELLPQLIEIN